MALLRAALTVLSPAPRSRLLNSTGIRDAGVGRAPAGAEAFGYRNHCRALVGRYSAILRSAGENLLARSSTRRSSDPPHPEGAPLDLLGSGPGCHHRPEADDFLAVRGAGGFEVLLAASRLGLGWLQHPRVSGFSGRTMLRGSGSRPASRRACRCSHAHLPTVGVQWAGRTARASG